MSFTVRRLKEGSPGRKVPWKPALLLLLQFGGPLLTWYRGWQERQRQQKRSAHRIRLLKRTAIVLLAILCAVALLGATLRGVLAMRLLTLRNVVSIAATDLPTDSYGHVNLLLLGQGDETGADLTDSIIVASLDPTHTKGAVLLSLPRDLYFLHTEKMGKGRINSLYRDYKGSLMYQGTEEVAASHMAMEQLGKEVATALGIDIHHIVKVDFEGFVEAVDAVGGIDIDVPQAIVDYEYPGPNYTFETFRIDAGPQHIDGATALKYARSRHTTSDFDRSARQQQLIKALGEKLKSEGLLSKPSRILSLVEILQKHVETTMDTRQMMGLASLGTDMDQSKMDTMQLNLQNGLYGEIAAPGGLLYAPPRDQFNGASVLLPVSIPEFPVTWKQLKTLTQLTMHKRLPTLASLPIAVLNAGAVSGSSRKLGQELTRFGFNIQSVENAKMPKQDTSFVAADDTNREKADNIASLLQVELRPLPPDLPLDQHQPITVVLGKEYKYTPLQDLPSVLP